MPKFKMIKGAVILRGEVVPEGAVFDGELAERQHLIDAGVAELVVDKEPEPKPHPVSAEIAPPAVEANVEPEKPIAPAQVPAKKWAGKK